MIDKSDADDAFNPRHVPHEFLDLSPHTARALWREGLRTREAAAAAGRVGWLRIPGIGRDRVREIDNWLGDDGPSHQREVKDAIRFLEREGYAVTGHGYPDDARPLPGAEKFTHPTLLCKALGFRILARDVLAVDLDADSRAAMCNAVEVAAAVLPGARYVMVFRGTRLDALYRLDDDGDWGSVDAVGTIAGWGWTLTSCDPRVGGVLPLYVAT